MDKIFKKGDRVKVFSDGNNASDFTRKLEGSPLGVYSLPNWRKIKFTIQGRLELTSFELNPDIYGAYLLSLNGKNIGYVYNIALKKL